MTIQSGFSQFIRNNLRGITGVAATALLCLLLLGGPVLQTGVQAQSSTDNPAFSFSRRSFSTNEGGSVEITVEKDGDGAASVNYATATATNNNAPATANDDYEPVSGTLDFADGDTEKTFTVSTVADSVDESAEGFLVKLSLSDGEPAELESPSISVVVILNCPPYCD